MMSKALSLLKREKLHSRTGSEKGSASRVSLDPSSPVKLAGYDEPVKAGVAARYWRLLNRKEKALAAQIGSVKAALRTAALGEMNRSEGYVASVVCGPVKVTRQNRFKAVPFEREELIDALGEVEYRTMFGETAGLEFASIEQMECFLRRCELAGVSVDATEKRVVKPRTSIRERLAEVGPALGQDAKELIEHCAQDIAPAVGKR